MNVHPTAVVRDFSPVTKALYQILSSVNLPAQRRPEENVCWFQVQTKENALRNAKRKSILTGPPSKKLVKTSSFFNMKTDGVKRAKPYQVKKKIP